MNTVNTQIAGRRFAFILWAVAVAFCSQVDPVFADIEPSLKAKTKVPVLLPQTLPEMGQGKDRIYAVMGRVSRERYEVILAFTPDCNGASFCRLGMLEGMAFRAAALQGKRVRLTDGIQAWFKESSCGAGCSDSVLSWRQGRAIYSAGLKGASLSDVVPLANAVIRASKR